MKPFWTEVVALKNMLEATQFLVTGSLALNLYGLHPENAIKDLDVIIINPTDETLRMLEKISILNKGTQFSDDISFYENGKRRLFHITLKQVEVDVFVEWLPERQKKANCLWYDHVEINPLMDIVKAKRSMGRSKDYISLINIANKFLKTPLPSLPNQTSESEISSEPLKPV